MPEWKRREVEHVCAELGDKVICRRCGARLDDFAERCTADLDVVCPGFVAIEEALRSFAYSPRRS
jgi:hypothetical protein